MDPEIAPVALVMGAVLLALMGLTASGQRRRGRGILLSLAAALLFPVTWTVWYLLDERPPALCVACDRAEKGGS